MNRGAIYILFFALTLFSPAASLGGADQVLDDATSVYRKKVIEEFTVYIHPEVFKHADEAKAMRDELARQLRAVKKVLPDEKFKKLKNIAIWVEWQRKKNGAAEFHVSKGYLAKNGYNPDKHFCVEINNAKNFVAWSKAAQPWMMLHELAHAYHFVVLGVNHPGIVSAFDNAVKTKRYLNVKHRNGKSQKAYALTNKQEYFSELSEAYFGKNDFYPFTADELKKYDPAGFKLMQTVWGEPKLAP